MTHMPIVLVLIPPEADPATKVQVQIVNLRDTRKNRGGRR